MKRLILIGIVFFAVYGYTKNTYSEEPEITDSLGYPLSNYDPGSFFGRVFGCCWPRHLGEDDKRSPLTPVRAIGNGKIITGIVSGAHTCYGMVVVVEHTLLDGGKITSVYGHMTNREGYKPRLSGVVKKGEIIGYVGHSGGKPPHGRVAYCNGVLDDENGDNEPHLHFGIRKGPAPKDEYDNYSWVYFGYGPKYGEDVDFDSKGKAWGGKFTAGKKFIDEYNAKYSDRDEDEDGVTVKNGDCDDKDKTVYPGAEELCDEKDNDCDEVADNGFLPTAQEVGKGDQCSDGLSDCRVWGEYICSLDKKSIVCDAVALPPGEELCDGKDNDCDGKIDNDIPSIGEECVAGEGECQNTGEVICLLEANPAGLYCSVAPLEPDCSGKECGDDGCGGSCGTCVGGDAYCIGNICVECTDDADCPAGEFCNIQSYTCEQDIPDQCKGVISFTDPNLERAVRDAIGKLSGGIYYLDVKDRTFLDAGDKDIQYLGGIECLTALTLLNLWSNQISDISPLSNLTALTDLDLKNNQISDISPLSNLTALTTLNLLSNQISDISPLSNLTALTMLYLWDNQISNISPLSNLTALTMLYLRVNQVGDISPLSNLTALTILDLWGNQISDISPLSNLTALTDLDLKNNQISDISPLSNLTALTILDLWGNEVSDISPLSTLTALTTLYLRVNQVGDISPLSNLTALTILDLWGNGVSDISPLSNLTALTTLWLDYNRISDISPLVSNSGIDNDDEVDIRYNPIDCAAQGVNIAELRSRGVILETDCP
ncbi:MAG: leucine-rich repeat domain-containing protein [Patescibacteria group bacterium]|nr:leucine-rich repeat domain-containing protein [Patescibacteria group bacterium]MDD5490679.1 leucine-rich repeat domain-containing protein [Patescibacteria group bacterium]